MLRRFQSTLPLPGSPPLFLVVDIEVEPVKVEGVMEYNDIIATANDRACNIKDYVVFDLNVVNTCIIRPEIIMVKLEFKPIMFQILEAISQYSSDANEDPHLHLRQFLEVASNFKIPGISGDASRLRLLPYPSRDRAKS